MPAITFQQLAGIQHPEKHSLNAACELTARRSRLKNFFGWAIYLMTCTLVARNRGLDRATRKIAAAAKAGLRNETFSLERRNLTLKALRNLIKATNLNMIQWRNFNIDPDWYLGQIGITETGDIMGIKQLQKLIHEEFPKVKFGYFNPPIERIKGNYELDFAH